MKLICNNIILGIDFFCYDKELFEFKKKKCLDIDIFGKYCFLFYFEFL